MTDRTKLMLMWPLAGFAAFAAFALGLIVMAAVSDRGIPSEPVGAEASVLEVELGDLHVKPQELTARPGAVEIAVRNSGAIEHDFSLGELGSTEMIPPGESATLKLADVDPGSYEFLCTVPGHADAGMKGILVVNGDAEHAGHTGMAGMSAEEMAAHDAEVIARFPEETQGTGAQALEPKMLPDGTKVFELTAQDVEWETEAGKSLPAMAYNGMVPGPTISAELGDRVRVVLRNEMAQPTAIHFHGMKTPNAADGVPGITQDAVMPGERFVYELTVRNSGSHMYHSHFNAVEQVPMGLLGAFIVSDPADPDVDVDEVMVLNDGPLGYTINGKGFPATAPIVVDKGDTLRVRYMNEGLQIHPMHLHGFTQKVIAKDGNLLPHPYEADTVLVGPGERYDVLITPDVKGVWAFHCHVLSHVEGPSGMFGMVTALVVQ